MYKFISTVACFGGCLGLLWTAVQCFLFDLSRALKQGLSYRLRVKLHRKNQGRPTSIFGKYLFGRRFETWNFRNICCKISCFPAFPRIFEHLKNGVIAHFYGIFTLKRSPRIFGSLFFWLKFSKR